MLVIQYGENSLDFPVLHEFDLHARGGITQPRIGTAFLRNSVPVGQRPHERIGDHLDDGLGGEHDAHLHVLLRQLLVPLQLGQILPACEGDVRLSESDVK